MLRTICRVHHNKGSNTQHRSYCAEATIKPHKIFSGIEVRSHDEVYYPRSRHEKLLRHLLAEEPSGIIPIIGPSNVGKTTFLKQFLQGRPVAHIDLERAGVIDGTDSFIRLLQFQFSQWGKTATDVVDRFTKTFGGAKVFGLEIPKEKSQLDIGDFNLLLRGMDDLLGKLKVLDRDGNNYPIILIDGAHGLRHMVANPESRDVLKAFFDWIVCASKQEKLCHVIVSSHHGLFVRWLHEFSSGTNRINLRTVLMSDLNKERSIDFMRQYFRHKAGQKLPDFNLNSTCLVEPDYEALYQVLGGRIPSLKVFIQDYVSGISHHDAIMTHIVSAERSLYEALTPEYWPNQVPWTKYEWLNCMREIVKEPTGSVEYHKLQEKTKISRTSLDSLIDHKLLIYRPIYSAIVDDERSVKGASLLPPSPVHLYAMKRVLANLPSPLMTVRVRTLNSEFYREIDLDDLTLADIKKAASAAFGTNPESITSIKLLPDSDLWRDADLAALRQKDKLIISITRNKNKEKSPRILVA